MEALGDRYCETCGDLLRRRGRESYMQFAARKLCSKYCVPRRGPDKMPQVIIDNWPMVNPTVDAIRHALDVGFYTAERLIRESGHTVTNAGQHRSIFCVAELLRAEKLYEQYAKQGLTY